jgi:EamA domain-containing membrane protein RarD
MQGIIHEAPTIWTFMLLTIALGGLAAWQTGRAIAQTWRPFSVLFVYAALLAVAIRFFHFALFEGTLLSLHYLIVDFVFLLAIGAIGWRMQRAEQMRTQYSFAYESSGPLAWKRK